MKNKLLALEENHSILDEEFDRLLKESESHNLKRNDFFYIVENKKKEKSEKRIPIQRVCDLLLEETNLKHLCLCTDCKIGFYLRPEGLYGPYSQLKIKTMLLRILRQINEPKFLTPYFVSQLLTCLKTSRIAMNSSSLLAKFRSVEK